MARFVLEHKFGKMGDLYIDSKIDLYTIYNDRKADTESILQNFYRMHTQNTKITEYNLLECLKQDDNLSSNYNEGLWYIHEIDMYKLQLKKIVKEVQKYALTIVPYMKYYLDKKQSSEFYENIKTLIYACAHQDEVIYILLALGEITHVFIYLYAVNRIRYSYIPNINISLQFGDFKPDIITIPASQYLFKLNNI